MLFDVYLTLTTQRSRRITLKPHSYVKIAGSDLVFGRESDREGPTSSSHGPVRQLLTKGDLDNIQASKIISTVLTNLVLVLKW